MAVIKGTGLYQIPYYGEYGNLSQMESAVPSGSVANADTVDFMTIPGGVKVVDVTTIFSAPTGGSAHTMSLGWRYADGSAGGSATAFFTTTSVAGTNTRTRLGNVANVQVEKDIIIYGTFAVTTGPSTVVPYEVYVDYKALGTK